MILALLLAVAPLDGASAAMARGDFEAALQLLARESGAGARLLEAQCHQALGHDAEVTRALGAALEADPLVKLDPQQASPDLVAQLEKLRTSAKMPLEVAAPEGAEVRVDTELRGVGPMTVRVSPGRHVVTALSADRKQEAVVEVKVETGRAARAELGPERFVARTVGSKATGYLRTGQILFNELEFERALEMLQRARSEGLSEAEDALAAQYEGMMLCELRRPDEASVAFLIALGLAPGSRLPVKVSKTCADLYESVRTKASGPVPGPPSLRTQVSSAPAPAPRDWRKIGVLPSVSAGLGAVALAVAVGTGVAAQGHFDRITATPPLGQVEAYDEWTRGRDLRVGSNVTYGVAGGLLLVAVLAYVVGLP